MNELEKYFVQPGYIYASQQQVLIHTVLGSCVAVCIWDEQKKYGGMNHYIYPKTEGNARNAQYGDASIPHLIRLMKNFGSKQESLVAHVIGGAQNPLLHSNIGLNNVEVALGILEKANIPIINVDTGGALGRKLSFNTATGEILIYKCMKLREGDWYD